ncbi:MAG: hypothetical protein M1840_001358 [Geoglossum simile]|nr:MAG: hypothetical protein M1840_001358 [Geoglossum simile]
MPRHHATTPIPHLSTTALPSIPPEAVYLFPTSHIHATIRTPQRSTPIEAVIPMFLTPKDIIKQVIPGGRGGWVVRVVQDGQAYGGRGIQGYGRGGGYGQGFAGRGGLGPEVLDGDLPIGGWVEGGGWVCLEVVREVDLDGWGIRERTRRTGRGGEGARRGVGFV